MKRLLLLALALFFGALAASAQVRYVHNEQHAGLSLSVGNQGIVYFSAAQLPGTGGSSAATFAPSAPGGDSMEVSWKWDPENGDPVQNISVRLERRPGQSIPNWAKDFRAAVEAMMGFYPPNVGESLGVSFGGPSGPPKMPAPSSGSSWAALGTGVVLEVSWKHDPDKEPDGTDGPLQPVTVTAKVEQREGETSREAARRLRQVVESLQEAFPPNVPTPGG